MRGTSRHDQSCCLESRCSQMNGQTVVELLKDDVDLSIAGPDSPGVRLTAGDC